MFLLSEHTPDSNNKLDVLYHKFAHSLWYVAMSYVKNDQLAEDIVQETFLKLTVCPEKIGQIDASQTRSFLFTIARHCCIDALRKQKRHQEQSYEEYVDFDAPGPDHQILPLEQLVMKETMEDVQKALAKMPERYRTPLELRLVYGLSNKEIAQILDISPNLVGVQVLRAKAMITRFLHGGRE